MSTWTRKIPKKGGLYWFRNKNGSVDVARNLGKEWRFIGTDEIFSSDEMKGNQFAPCVMPEGWLGRRDK